MREKTKPFVSVIIPVFNDSEHLNICLEALENQTYPKHLYEIIVVDNGSDHSIKPLVEKYRHVQTTDEPRQGSYAARNKGISIAKGEIIAFTDADCIPSPDWVENGVGHLLGAPNCGLVGGKIETFFKDPSHPTGAELYGKVATYPQQHHVEAMKFSVTANLFTSRNVLERVGPFDDEMKSEGDIEWGQRVFSTGFVLLYAGDTRVKHPARPSLGSLYRKIVRERGGLHDYHQKHPAFFSRFYKPTRLTSIKLAFAVCSDKTLNGIQKAKVMFVIGFVQCVATWERLRLQFGRPSKR